MSCDNLASYRTNLTLADLHEIRVRINMVLCVRFENGKTAQVHLATYPFVGVRDDSVAMTEDPENWLTIFAMSKFRNKPPTAILELDLHVGDRIWIEVPKTEERKFGKKQMPPPIDL